MLITRETDYALRMLRVLLDEEKHYVGHLRLERLFIQRVAADPI